MKKQKHLFRIVENLSCSPAESLSIIRIVMYRLPHRPKRWFDLILF